MQQEQRIAEIEMRLTNQNQDMKEQTFGGAYLQIQNLEVDIQNLQSQLMSLKNENGLLLRYA